MLQELEALDGRIDFALVSACKEMIKTYCHEADTGELFPCLRRHKEEQDFATSCKRIIVERQRIRATGKEWGKMTRLIRTYKSGDRILEDSVSERRKKRKSVFGGKWKGLKYEKRRCKWYSRITINFLKAVSAHHEMGMELFDVLCVLLLLTCYVYFIHLSRLMCRNEMFPLGLIF